MPKGIAKRKGVRATAGNGSRDPEQQLSVRGFCFPLPGSEGPEWPEKGLVARLVSSAHLKKNRLCL